MFGCRRRAERRDAEVDPVPGERDDVHIALDHDEVVDLSQRLAGLVETVEFAALVKQDRFR